MWDQVFLNLFWIHIIQIHINTDHAMKKEMNAKEGNHGGELKLE